MSGKGAPELSVRNCGDLRVAVIAAQWHEKVMDGLVDGALRALRELGIDEPTLLRVPGSFELPVVAKVLAGAATTPSSRSASSSAAAHPTSNMCARASPRASPRSPSTPASPSASAY